MADKDFLDEVIDERTRRNPDFPQLVEAAERRRALIRRLAEAREQQELSQTTVAARMQTSQSAVARLEKASNDAKLSTLDRLASALGLAIEYRVVEATNARRSPVHRRT